MGFYEFMLQMEQKLELFVFTGTIYCSGKFVMCTTNINGKVTDYFVKTLQAKPALFMPEV